MITNITIYCTDLNAPDFRAFLLSLKDNAYLHQAQIVAIGGYESTSKPCDNSGCVKEPDIECLNRMIEIEPPKIAPLLPPMSKTELCQGRTDKQRREQDKWRRKFYKK